MTISPVEARNDPRNSNLPLMNQPQTILGTTITFLTLAILAASLRLWSRIRDRLWGWDDAFVFLAGIASVAGDSVVCMMPFDGLGLHFYTLSDSDKSAYFKHIWASNSAYCASTTFIKLAILFQYVRLFAETATSTTSRQYRRARASIWIMIGLSATWGLCFFLLALFPCKPVAKNWNPSLQGKCVGWGTKEPNTFFAMWVGHATTNMVLDIVVLLLPLPFLGVLRIEGKSKVGLIALFAMGGVVAALSVGRVISLVINRAGTFPVLDMSYYAPLVYIFSVLEVNIAILCASIPIFWPMISSLAANKILVVNEIVVHVEEYQKTSFDGQSGIGLAEQAAFKSPFDSPTTSPQHPHSGRLSTIVRSFERPSKDLSRKAKRRSKSSIASSFGKTHSRSDHDRRPSQDSQHNLTTQDSGSLRSDYDWFVELDRDSVGKRTTTRIETGATANPFSTRAPSAT
ncbi:hypothetical protein OPT61_g1187 [Boeremia exigua]|uniref:Uncharacterized protein n=1 Tax=Boeremia exigua TaxID=749465 RepID=A0ACC2IR08_9PLEO|nr:hypothetical protein OPT61_g1187 [Boeremia exigua]